MMTKINTYVKESYHEMMHEVTWPTMETLQKSTMIVISATLITTLIVWLMDTGAASLLKGLYTVFK